MNKFEKWFQKKLKMPEGDYIKRAVDKIKKELQINVCSKCLAELKYVCGTEWCPYCHEKNSDK